ncbi:MAG: DUF4957 domain-containing protein [Bacteroidaceae bacterium]|nr:DUF4957 domain-containing protein [Bacteroidaceae bacterium]
MNTFIKNISLGLCLGALAFGATACSEPGDILSSVDYSRLFSPTDIEARVTERTAVNIAWSTKDTRSTSFVVELATDKEFTKVAKSATVTEPKCKITSLDGETEYFVRVKASNGKLESLWSPLAKFTTDTENILLPMRDGDIAAKAVTLRWTPGETVEAVDVTDELGAAVKSQKITAEECTAGVATITGLKSETTYTFALKRNGKTRGVITVTTELDLDGATKVTTDDDWYNMLKSAKAGTVFAFMPGEYKAYDVEGAVFTGINIPASVSIKAAKSTDKPVISGVNFKLADGASLDLINIVLNGSNGTAAHADQAIVTGADGAIDHINITGCEISNYTKGVIYVNTATAISLIDFNHNYIHDIECNGGDGFDFRKGAAKLFSFTNNSVVNVAAVGKRDLFRMDSGGASVVAEGLIVIENNNFENCSASGKRVLYIRLGDKFPITFTHNVISNTASYYSNQKTTCIGEISNNNYFNASGFYTPDEAGANVIDKSEHLELDPKYDNLYYVTNEDLIYKLIGNFK